MTSMQSAERDEVEMLSLMLLIRRFEERASQQYQSQKIGGFGVVNLSFVFRNTTHIEIRFDQAAHLARAIDKRRIRCAAR